MHALDIDTVARGKTERLSTVALVRYPAIQCGCWQKTLMQASQAMQGGYWCGRRRKA
jgi:hypothetical protein